MDNTQYSLWLSARATIGLVIMATAIGGGILATYYNVRNAIGPKEKAFVSQVCVVSWLIVFSLLLFAYFLPSPHRFVVAALYLIVCPLLVYRWTNKHQLIRMIEQRDAEEEVEEEKAEDGRRTTVSH